VVVPAGGTDSHGPGTTDGSGEVGVRGPVTDLSDGIAAVASLSFALTLLGLLLILLALRRRARAGGPGSATGPSGERLVAIDDSGR
jgi:hypothetical protein